MNRNITNWQAVRKARAYRAGDLCRCNLIMKKYEKTTKLLKFRNANLELVESEV